jgi:hypothetical protein
MSRFPHIHFAPSPQTGRVSKPPFGQPPLPALPEAENAITKMKLFESQTADECLSLVIEIHRWRTPSISCDTPQRDEIEFKII